MGIKPYVVPVKVHSGINLHFLGSNFCQGARCGFSTLRALFFFSFQFFSFLFPFFDFLSFFFVLFFVFFCIFVLLLFLYFSLALTFAWVALPGFRPSEPLKGKSLALSMLIGLRSQNHLNPREWLLFADDVEVHPMEGEFALSVVDRKLVVLRQYFLLSSLLGFGILADLCL